MIVAIFGADHLDRLGIRGPFLVTAAIIGFAFLVRPFGLVIASYATIVTAASATREVRWIETLIWAAALTAFCAVLFPRLLNLPIPIWPRL
jgi:hypothetical protein